ncbi:MAG: TetR/AcrR family transcriptional regulator [Candidatus Thiodiazotropha sp. (ex. Lucinoma kazani)]
MSERKLYSWGEAEKKLSRKGQKRIEAILDTARRVLTESGLGDFSMNKVAANSGISLGNLQYYFPKKKGFTVCLTKQFIGTGG